MAKKKDQEPQSEGAVIIEQVGQINQTIQAQGSSNRTRHTILQQEQDERHDENDSNDLDESHQHRPYLTGSCHIHEKTEDKQWQQWNNQLGDG